VKGGSRCCGRPAGNWSSHKDARQGAALGYYSVYSIGPIIVIAIAVAGLFFGREVVSGQVAASIKDMLGDSGATAVQPMLADAGRPQEGMLATFLGVGTLLFATIGVVVQFKDALNTVWEVEEQPGHGVWHFIRSYIVSLAAVLPLGFLLFVTLVVTAVQPQLENLPLPTCRSGSCTSSASWSRYL
jgi:membrane protein